MKKNKLKEQKQNLIEALIFKSGAGEKEIIDLLEEIKAIDNKLDKKRQKIDRKRHEAFLEIKNNTTSAIKKVFEPSSQKTKECLDYYDDWLKQMKDSITKVNKCKNEWEKVIKKWLPIGIVNSDIPDLKIDEHKNRVCSELAEKSPFHINDFENEYDKLKWHFLENKLKDRLQSIAEFAASSGFGGMSHVGNFLIKNKSTS